jgi:PIN domain nuclease of toxin-antitoxin system
MTSLVLDTHSALWYLTNSEDLSSVAGDAMDEAVAAGETLWISAVTIVEITYLVEKLRVPGEVERVLHEQLADATSALRCIAFDHDMAMKLRQVARQVVPDMPDRMIAATALHLGLPLVTADHEIHRSGIPVIW